MQTIKKITGWLILTGFGGAFVYALWETGIKQISIEVAGIIFILVLLKKATDWIFTK